MTTRTNWILALATLAVAAWGFTGCAHGPATVEQTETVGTLAPSYHSVAVQPVHESTPPPSFEIAGSADDDDAAAPVVTAADAGPDVAPEVTSKGAGLQLRGAR